MPRQVSFLFVALTVNTFGVQMFAQSDACQQLAKEVDHRAQDYRRATRDVGRSCPADGSECATLIQQVETALSVLLEAHQNMVAACTFIGPPPPPPPPPPPISPTIPGDLVVTEIMADPSATTDAQGEWFEMYNPTGSWFELSGLTVKDDGTNQFTISTSVVVPPNDFVVLGNNADQTTNGGVFVDYVYSNFSLGNTTDVVDILNGTVSLDRVAYTSATFPIQSGAAISLSSDHLTATANDIGSNWCVATDVLPGGDLGTPGSPNPHCP